MLQNRPQPVWFRLQRLSPSLVSGATLFLAPVLVPGFPFGMGPAAAIAQILPGSSPAFLISQAAVGPSRPVLKLGSQGTEVQELQGALKLLGYYSGPVDGNFGETTAAAVVAFQRAAGLTSDGVVGATTWNRLFPSGTTPISPPSTPKPSPAPPKPSPQPAPPNPSSVDLPVLKQGMRGSAVVLLQERLRNLSVYKGSADGVFGPGTKAAVEAVQREYRLNPDGVVGPSTWAILMRR